MNRLCVNQTLIFFFKDYLFQVPTHAVTALDKTIKLLHSPLYFFNVVEWLRPLLLFLICLLMSPIRSLWITVLTLFFFIFLEQTGVALGHELTDKMPPNEYYEYFGPDYTLHVAPSNMENKNTRHQLDDIKSKLLDNLSKLRHAPSVQFQERPPEAELPEVRILLQARN